MNPVLEVEVASRDDTTRIILRGGLDMATADDLTATVVPWLDDRPELRSIVIDVTDLTFMDSSGIKAIYDLTTPPRDLAVTLVSPTRAVRRVLDITGLVPADADTSDEVLITHLDGAGVVPTRLGWA
ncbi:MAG TPA: STAS domain-containing protein [Actinomycetota bacterium]